MSTTRHLSDVDQEVATRIRVAREEKKLSRHKLAKMISVSTSLIQRWEEGKRPVRDVYVPRLSDALGLHLNVRVADDGINRLASIAKPATKMIVMAGDMLKNEAVTIRNSEVIKAFDALLSFTFHGNPKNKMGL